MKSISKTVFPLDYDKNANKTDKAFNEWAAYIDSQINKVKIDECLTVIKK